jgi:uncharacterized membrane protein YphA (DoxX/SURF4 family)
MRQFLAWVDERFSGWLFRGFPLARESLALYRISFAGYHLLFGIPNYVWISANPNIFFDPHPSLALLFNGFPSYFTLQLFSSLVCLLFIMLLFGYRTRLVSVLLTATLIFANSFKYSFGKIDHDIMPVMIPLVMSFSGWGACFSLDSLRQTSRERYALTQSWPVAFIALLIAIGFFSAGLPKALKWIDFDLATHGVRRWVTSAFYIEGHDDLLVPLFVKITNPYFWESLDVLAVIFELGFLATLPFPGAFRLYIGLAVLFHFNNHLMLNIPFAEYMVVYLLFINWEAIHAYVKKKHILDRLQDMLRLKYLWMFVAIYLPLYYMGQTVVSGTSARTSSPLQFFIRGAFELDYTDLRGVVVVSTATVIVLMIALSKVRHWFAGAHKGRQIAEAS